MYVLDTDHISIIQGRTEPEYSHLRARISEHPKSDFFVTIVSFHEQLLGWNSYLSRAKGRELVYSTENEPNPRAADPCGSGGLRF